MPFGVWTLGAQEPCGLDLQRKGQFGVNICRPTVKYVDYSPLANVVR